MSLPQQATQSREPWKYSLASRPSFNVIVGLHPFLGQGLPM